MASGRKAETPSLEAAGIHAGSQILASAAEQEQLEQAERERTDAGIATLDASLVRMWACACCGTPGAAAFERDGLCVPCRAVIHRLQVQQYCAEEVDGVTRAELAGAFLARRST
jgi:hypothetical protein